MMTGKRGRRPRAVACRSGCCGGSDPLVLHVQLVLEDALCDLRLKESRALRFERVGHRPRQTGDSTAAVFLPGWAGTRAMSFFGADLRTPQRAPEIRDEGPVLGSRVLRGAVQRRRLCAGCRRRRHRSAAPKSRRAGVGGGALSRRRDHAEAAQVAPSGGAEAT